MYPYDSNLQDQLAKLLVGNTLMQQQTPIHTVKVNGRGGAESYNMPPNSDTVLLDQNSPLIWFIQTDGAGYKTITAYDISLHEEVKPEDKFSEIEKRLTRIEEELKNGKSNTRPNESRQHNDAGNRGNAQG